MSKVVGRVPMDRLGSVVLGVTTRGNVPMFWLNGVTRVSVTVAVPAHVPKTTLKLFREIINTDSFALLVHCWRGCHNVRGYYNPMQAKV